MSRGTSIMSDSWKHFVFVVQYIQTRQEPAVQVVLDREVRGQKSYI